MLCDKIIQANKLKIEAVILTEDEQKESDFEGRKRKWFKMKHSDYWKNQTHGKGNTKTTE